MRDADAHRAGLALLAIEDGDSIVSGTAGANEVSIDDVTGGTFTHWSRLSCCDRNNSSSDLIRFSQGAEGEFQIDDPSAVLANLSSTTFTAVNWSGWSPANDTGVIGTEYVARNNGDNARYVRFRRTATGADLYRTDESGKVTSTSPAFWDVDTSDIFWCAVAGADLSTAFYVAWNATDGTLDADIFPRWVVLS